jgi:beta-lactam-binding protein with PASTA domain
VTPPTISPTPAPPVPTTSAPAPTTTPPSPTPAAEVEIPSVRTFSYAEAVALLARAGFPDVERVNEVSDLPAGQVIDTNPPAGTTLRPGTPIQIRVSTGPPVTTTAAPTTPAAAD